MTVSDDAMVRTCRGPDAEMQAKHQLAALSEPQHGCLSLELSTEAARIGTCDEQARVVVCCDVMRSSVWHITSDGGRAS